MKLVCLPALICTLTSAVSAATFGKVVPIGGHVSDLAYDVRRNVLYIANFTANRIDVMSTIDNTLRSPISVAHQPSTLGMSPDGRYLVVGHYAQWDGDVTLKPALTILDLDANLRQTLALASSPLAVAFGNGAKALVVTTKDFQLLDPTTGTLRLLATGNGLKTEELPVAYPKFPPEILQASSGVSGDREIIYVLAQGAESTAVVLFRVSDQSLAISGVTASPELGPRVISVNRDGTAFLAGWALMAPGFLGLAQFPYPTGSLNTGSHAYDWSRNLIYAQIPVATTTSTTPVPAPTPTTPSPAPAPAPAPPVLHIADTDNLTIRERIQLPENLAGRSVFSPDMQILYAASDSGVTVLPVGLLDEAPRVVSLQEQVAFRGNACDRRLIVREIDIVDAGGGRTDFSLSGAPRGVRVFPSSGSTPARVTIEVDPTVFQNQKGTVTAQLEIKSSGAINLPMPVRLLINNREPEQRGAFINVPGKLVDLLADSTRNRFYVIRQDRNQVLVFDGATSEQIATLRTGNTPTQMAITRDSRYLIVGNDNSQLANVYDLDTLRPTFPIIFPPGHYPRSIAVSNRAILASVRSVASSEHKIDRVHFDERFAAELPSLGIFKNAVNVDTVLMASPSGQSVIAAMPDGNVLLYDADADTFVAARKDLSAVSGALAAISDEMFLVDNNILNWSLVPVGKLESGTGVSSGFAFVDALGLRTTTPSPSSPGVIQRLDLSTFDAVRPTRMVESPQSPGNLRTPNIGQIGQTIPQFLRSLVPLPNRSAIVSLSTSGITMLPWDFDAAIAAPSIERVVNAADQSEAVAPGGLITVHGQNLSPVTAVNSEVPVPTTLGEACLTVNGTLLPIMMASPNRINAQLPFAAVGAAGMVIRAPGGASNSFAFTIYSGAPAVFRDAVSGPNTGLATVVRASNNLLVTLSNPIHPEDEIVIYLTGLGRTSPQVEAGAPAPAAPLALAATNPEVTLGNTPLSITFAGLVPGQVGVYQINAKVPFWVSTGMEIPLTIRQGGQATTLPVRVVK
jgi:uncharacterized protein (TIGR03437 family)